MKEHELRCGGSKKHT